MYLLSTATEALGVRGRPWAPIGPSFGSPPFFSLKKTNLNFTKPVVAQDTGGAIKGPIRFDFFWGFGDEAGKNAGRQKSKLAPGSFYRNGT